MDTLFMSMVVSLLPSELPRLFVVMGVAGCGKTSVGQGLAKRFGGQFMDGDDFHPDSNIAKMSRGEALNDDDRWPWLEIIAKEMSSRDGIVFAGCSALKKTYRDLIRRKCGEPVCFVHLTGSKDLIASRMAARKGHFMPTSLLDSQFAALEPLDTDEIHFLVDIAGSQSDVIQRAGELISAGQLS
jgi:gluconokinase